MMPKHNVEGGRWRAKEKYSFFSMEGGENKLRKWGLNLNFYLTKVFSEPQLNRKPYAPTHPGLPHLKGFVHDVPLPLHPPHTLGFDFYFSAL